MKTKWILILLSLCLVYCWGQEKKREYVIKGPEHWRNEYIPFPLGFAPDIAYSGFEELCFAPGMFKPESDSYFSYVFLMKIEGKQNFSVKEIDDLLYKYYRGLCQAVAKSNKLNFDLSKIKVKTTLLPMKKGERGSFSFDATVDWYDAFVTGKKMTLDFDIITWQKGKYKYLFACVSPFSRKEKIWQAMHDIRADFVRTYRK